MLLEFDELLSLEFDELLLLEFDELLSLELEELLLLEFDELLSLELEELLLLEFDDWSLIETPSADMALALAGKAIAVAVMAPAVITVSLYFIFPSFLEKPPTGNFALHGKPQDERVVVPGKYYARPKRISLQIQ